MNLVIDIGNTRMKYAFFDCASFVEACYLPDRLWEDIRKWKEEGGPLHILLSGSGRITPKFRLTLKESADFFVEASSRMELPLKIGYATRSTLGFDRIANCVGAMELFPQTPLLVIDSGTCITFNYVNAEGVFLGGNISPGLGMRFKSLHEYTAKLPCVAPDYRYGGIGRTTEEAIRNGVMDGMLFEVECYTGRWLECEKSGRVVITGGNACYLKSRLASEFCFCDILGFVGLNKILQCAKNCH